jgi:signal transduction histidine kinase
VHAGAGRAEVRVRSEDDWLDRSVLDDGHGNCNNVIWAYEHGLAGRSL